MQATTLEMYNNITVSSDIQIGTISRNNGSYLINSGKIVLSCISAPL